MCVKSKDAARLHEMLCSWQQSAAMLEAGEISKEDYDKWRYHYPEFDTTDHWHKVVPLRTKQSDGRSSKKQIESRRSIAL